MVVLYIIGVELKKEIDGLNLFFLRIQKGVWFRKQFKVVVVYFRIYYRKCKFNLNGGETGRDVWVGGGQIQGRDMTFSFLLLLGDFFVYLFFIRLVFKKIES